MPKAKRCSPRVTVRAGRSRSKRARSVAASFSLLVALVSSSRRSTWLRSARAWKGRTRYHASPRLASSMGSPPRGSISTCETVLGSSVVSLCWAPRRQPGDRGCTSPGRRRAASSKTLTIQPRFMLGGPAVVVNLGAAATRSCPRRTGTQPAGAARKPMAITASDGLRQVELAVDAGARLDGDEVLVLGQPVQYVGPQVLVAEQPDEGVGQKVAAADRRPRAAFARPGCARGQPRSAPARARRAPGRSGGPWSAHRSPPSRWPRPPPA